MNEHWPTGQAPSIFRLPLFGLFLLSTYLRIFAHSKIKFNNLS